MLSDEFVRSNHIIILCFNLKYKMVNKPADTYCVRQLLRIIINSKLFDSQDRNITI